MFCASLFLLCKNQRKHLLLHIIPHWLLVGLVVNFHGRSVYLTCKMPQTQYLVSLHKTKNDSSLKPTRIAVHQLAIIRSIQDQGTQKLLIVSGSSFAEFYESRHTETELPCGRTKRFQHFIHIIRPL